MSGGRPVLAILGGRPAFANALCTSPNVPAWERVEAAFRGVFERRFFANNGPLVQELDERISALLAAHAVCVTNDSMAFMILAKALDCSSEIIVPLDTPSETLSALHYAGLSPVLCPLDEETQIVSLIDAACLITGQTSALLAAHAWGRVCDPSAFETFARGHNLRLIFDATRAMGSSINGRIVGSMGDGEVLSFHQSTIVNGAEGGCITTRSEELAKKLRTMRNFAASQTFAPSPLRTNGKMSEAQALLALLSLDDLQANMRANRERYEAYSSGTQSLIGLRLLPARDGTNGHYILAHVDEKTFGVSRDHLVTALARENVVVIPQRADWLELPNGPSVTPAAIQSVCDCLAAIHERAPEIRGALGERA